MTQWPCTSCTPRWRFISSIRNCDHVLKTLYRTFSRDVITFEIVKENRNSRHVGVQQDRSFYGNHKMSDILIMLLICVESDKIPSLHKLKKLYERLPVGFLINMAYRIAGKFGGNYVWQNGLQVAKNKYWRNLNLAIGNRACKFLLRHQFCTAKSAHIVQLKTEVEVMEKFQLESCVQGHHIRLIQEYVDSIVGEVLSVGSWPHVWCYAWL